MDNTRNSDFKVIGLFLVLGWIFNMSTWFHPLFFPAVKWTILALLPIVLVVGLKKPHYILWFVFLIFFTQDSFPNNVIYETYYGYEAPTVYFHSFISILSVFDVVLLGSIYIILLRSLKEKNVKNIFKGRIEYYLISLVVAISLLIALARGNEFKTIVQEIQLWVYAALLYFLASQAIKDKNQLLRTVYYLVLLLILTVPFEFAYFSFTNYHSLLAVVGRLRKPLINGIDDTYMVIPIYILMTWLVAQNKNTKPFLKILATFAILVGLSVIYLNTGRALTLITLMGIILFFITRKFNIRVYLYALLIPLFLFFVSSILQPEHISRILDTFTSVFSAATNYKKDMSAADRVVEFMNVAETLKQDKSTLFGLGWGGLWREYYYQPGRGSLAAYADKTLTTHLQTHTLLSQLFVKCGYIGTAIIILCFLSLWIHYFHFYRNFPVNEWKNIILGLLLIYPVYLYFLMVFQIGIVLGIIIAFLRKMELLNIQNKDIAS